MSDKIQPSVLVDTSHLISLYDNSKGRVNHSTALKYHKYFLKHTIKIYLSPIVIAEFQQKQSVADILSSGNYIPLPFNVEDGVKTADIAFNLGSSKRDESSVANFKDDLKLMAQAELNDITYIITEDDATLARYCKKLSKAGMFKSKIILLKDGFDGGLFNGGQITLINDEQ